MRKYMPRTFWTFMIGTLALMGIFPLAGFWSKDEILAGANRLGGDGGYQLMLDHGHHRRLLHRRLHDPGHLVRASSASRGARPRRTPRTSPARASRCRSIILAVPRPSSPGSSTCRHRRPVVGPRDASPCASSTSSSPPRPYFPARSTPTSPPRVHVVDRRRLDRRRRSSASASPTSGTGRARARTASPSATRSPAPATRSSRTSTTSTASTPTSSSAAIKGPIARAAYWVNQNVIDGVVNRRRHAAPSRAASGSTTTSTRAWSTRIVNGSGAAAEGSRPGPAQAADRQGPAVRRLPVRRRHRARRHLRRHRQRQLRTEEETHREGPARRLGAHRRHRSCPWSGRR